MIVRLVADSMGQPTVAYAVLDLKNKLLKNNEAVITVIVIIVVAELEKFFISIKDVLCWINNNTFVL